MGRGGGGGGSMSKEGGLWKWWNAGLKVRSQKGDMKGTENYENWSLEGMARRKTVGKEVVIGRR